MASSTTGYIGYKAERKGVVLMAIVPGAVLRNSKNEPCVSLRTAAAMIGVSKTRVEHYIAEGRLPAEKVVGGMVLTLIPLAAVQDFERRPTGRPRDDVALAGKKRRLKAKLTRRVS